MAYHADQGSGYNEPMTPDEKTPDPTPPTRARTTGPLQPLPQAPGATADLSAALLRRGKPPAEPAPPAGDDEA